MHLAPRLLAIAILLSVSGCGAPDDAAPPTAPSPSRTILVTGATGTQGGAVARELLSRGYTVRALTRSPDKPAARAIQERGATLVEGDYFDRQSLLDAMHGAHGVFAVTTWSEGTEREVEQGRRLIDAAATADIGHFVFTSVAGADNAGSVAHFASKLQIEEDLAASALDWTVIRPVEFMENWRYSWQGILAGRYVDPREPDTRHQWIASDDIGYFVAEAFDRPDEWIGHTEEIAGDELSLTELMATLSDVLGRPVEQVQPAWPDYRAAAGDEMADMYRWFNDVGYDVDIAALREAHPGLTTVRDYLQGLASGDTANMP